MLEPAGKDKKGMPVMAHLVFVFGPDKKLKLSILYPATTGRNFEQILRVVISLQLTAEKKVAILGDWEVGDSVMVLPTILKRKPRNLFLKDSSPKSSHLARNTWATRSICRSPRGAGARDAYLAQ